MSYFDEVGISTLRDVETGSHQSYLHVDEDPDLCMDYAYDDTIHLRMWCELHPDIHQVNQCFDLEVSLYKDRLLASIYDTEGTPLGYLPKDTEWWQDLYKLIALFLEKNEVELKKLCKGE